MYNWDGSHTEQGSNWTLQKISLPLQTAMNWSINRRVVSTHEFHTKSTIETELSLLGISYLGILLNTHT